MRVGIDAQPVADVHDALASHGDRYRRRVFTDHEVVSCGGWGAAPDGSVAEGLAARFAAKEATIKVLRVTDRVPPWTDIEVVRSGRGWPELSLSGLAQQLADEQGLRSFEISLTHTADMAVAVVVSD